MVTKRDIYAIVAAYGLGRVLPAGSSRAAAKSIIRVIAAPAARLGLAAGRRHPVGAAALLGYGAYEAGLLDPGIEFGQEVITKTRKKTMTKFNRAVKEGMKIVKASTSYGPKGIINNPKKAFSAVTKAVSKARRGAKLPIKGVLRAVAKKANAILGKMARMTKQQQRRTRKDRYRIFK